MKISISREDDLAICSVQGEISYENLEAIREEIAPYLEMPLQGLILDLTDVAYLDSSGLSLLMRCHAHMMRLKGKFVLVGVGGHVDRVFRMMRLESVLTIVKTMEEAKGIIQSMA